MIITGQEKHEGFTLEVKSETSLGVSRPHYYFFALDEEGNELISKDLGTLRESDVEVRYNDFKKEVSEYASKQKTETNKEESEEDKTDYGSFG
jgi:hypothetical protein